ncbi:MmgE/PrpD family protein [Salinispora arenicola]|uniref:2-methylcitrate dehydratase PrpD n=1 Tax=Salinispora arenicola TaxID=168697 RepID=A0A542XKK5_SALAC|nr:MmgE/PrpD family protein [Salinispora arenicola]TQL36368.1 2-methylcitrate dehydratase PrpD [Salinispora arenicola]GIM84187.1 MmgE/PrpD family protein [Salinispora arenicola]
MAGTTPTDPDGPTGRLATWLAETSVDAIPTEVTTRARHLILDGIGCLLVGARLPWSRIAVQSLTVEPGASVVAGWDRTASAPTAVTLNSSFIQGFELDDVSYHIPWHANAVVLPVLLAVAGLRGKVTGAEFLRAEVLGFETGARVGLALHGPRLVTHGWHSGAVFGGPGAAAAGGVLYGLTPARFEDALGIAATQSCGLMANEAMVKRMQHGFAARNGLVAAMLAAGGYGGTKRIFERGYGGYLTVYGAGHDPDPSHIDDALGEHWYLREQTIKPYAAMGYTHPAIDAALALRAADRVDPAATARIEIEVADSVFDHTAFPIHRPIESVAAQMSVRYVTATALLDGTVSLEQLRPDRLDRDDVWRLVDRTTVTRGSGSASQGRVRLTDVDGRTHEHHTDAPLGSVERPLNDAAIVDKYRDLTGRIVDRHRQRAIEDLVLHLDEHRDGPAALLTLLAPAVGDALD